MYALVDLNVIIGFVETGNSSIIFLETNPIDVKKKKKNKNF